jgi:hypothetical protein
MKPQRDSLTITYRSKPPRTPRSTALNTTFVFDHTTQMKVVPKAAARGSALFGKRTMNSSGTAAAAFNGDLTESNED